MECEISFKRLQQCMKLFLMARCKDSSPCGNAGCEEKALQREIYLCKRGLEWKKQLKRGKNPQWWDWILFASAVPDRNVKNSHLKCRISFEEAGTGRKH